jgi:aprataxin
LTLFDKYPKACVSFLGVTEDTRRLCVYCERFDEPAYLAGEGDESGGQEAHRRLKKDAEIVKGMVEKEMLKKHGYKWEVWIGFHAVPSLVYVRELQQQQYHHKKMSSPFSY